MTPLLVLVALFNVVDVSSKAMYEQLVHLSALGGALGWLLALAVAASALGIGLIVDGVTSLNAANVPHKSGPDTISGLWNFTQSPATAGGTNFLINPDFERWTNGVTVAPDSWTLNGAAAAVAKDTTNFRIGDCSAGLTRAGTDCYLAQRVDQLRGNPPAAVWGSKPVVFGQWVRATVAARARIAINDGATTTFSSYHSGGSGWEFLTVTKTLQAVPTAVEVRGYVDTGNTVAQFDGGSFTYGSGLSDYVPSFGRFLETPAGLYNHSYNGSFETWGAGVAAAPTRWVLTGAAATVARDAANFKHGTYGAAITRAGTDCYLEQRIDDMADHGPVAFWKSKVVTFGCWVRATAATTTRLVISDGVATYTSSYHSGGSAFEWLTVTATVAATATSLTIRCQVDTTNTTSQFDGATLVQGYWAFDHVPSGWRGRKCAFSFGDFTNTQAGSTTKFYGPGSGSNASEIIVSGRVPFKGVARNLYADADANVTANAAFTLRKQETTNTILTATIPNAARTASDLANEAELAKGDLITMQVVTLVAGTRSYKASFEYEEVP